MTVAAANKSKSPSAKVISGALFDVNDFVVYPGHGVAKINRVVEKSVGKDLLAFFELLVLKKGITALVPAGNFDAVGIRPVSNKAAIKKMLQLLAEPTKPVVVVGTSWGRRNREYTSRIARGDLLDLAQIYRDLRNASKYKELSFGEKAYVLQVEALLIEEVCIVERCSVSDAIAMLRRESA